MEEPRQAFLDAQQRMLARHEVDARSVFVDLPSLPGRAHVLSCGSGPDVVLLSGIGTPGAMWAPLMTELTGLRLLAVDLPGYGLTDAPRNFSRALRTNAVAFLTGVLDALELDRPGFLANSLGGLWASWLALEQPERVSALAYVGCPAVALGSSAPLPMRLLSCRPLGRLMTRLQPPSPGQVQQLAKMVGQHPLEPELEALLVATERLPHFRPTFLPMLHALIRLRGSRPAMWLTAGDLARIHQPAVVFWGDREPFAPRAIGEQIAAHLPHGRFQLVRGGHAPWLGDAQTIGPAAAQFLRQHVQ